MNRILFILWAIIPVAIIAWHLGPGRDQLEADRAGVNIRAAEKALRQGEWLRAADEFARARQSLPERATSERWNLAFAEADARIKAGQFIAGQGQLETLIDAMNTAEAADQVLLDAVYHELGVVSYNIAWLMRVEGFPEDRWRPEVERASEVFRLLARTPDQHQSPKRVIAASPAQGHQRAHKWNLEAALKLAKMDVEQLKAQPLPGNSANCDLFQQLDMPRPRPEP